MEISQKLTILEKLFKLFKHKSSQTKLKLAPLFITNKDVHGANVKEYNSIEAAIADLENDTNISAEKIEKLKSYAKMLKDKTSIKIKNGELLK